MFRYVRQVGLHLGVVSVDGHTHTYTHTHTHINEFPHSSDDTPTLRELESLTRNDGMTFSVMEELGGDYYKFGIILLQDETGRVMDDIRANIRGSYNINREIFKRWLRGRGKKPTTWRTLVELLRWENFGVLASNVRDALD